MTEERKYTYSIPTYEEQLAAGAPKPTDLAVLLGVAESYRRCPVWSSSANKYGRVRVVSRDGNEDYQTPNARGLGYRLAIKVSDPSSLHPNEDGLIGTGLYYPQTVASKDVSAELEKKYKSGNLEITKDSYTFDSYTTDVNDKPFKPKKYQVYALNGKRYIRVDQPTFGAWDNYLSNGEAVQGSKVYWVEESEIMARACGDVLITDMVLFTGIRFNDGDRYDGNPSKTEAYMYLNKYFAKEVRHGNTSDRTTTKAKDATYASTKATQGGVFAALDKITDGKVLRKVTRKAQDMAKTAVKTAVKTTVKNIKETATKIFNPRGKDPYS